MTVRERTASTFDPRHPRGCHGPSGKGKGLGGPTLPPVCMRPASACAPTTAQAAAKPASVLLVPRPRPSIFPHLPILAPSSWVSKKPSSRRFVLPAVWMLATVQRVRPAVPGDRSGSRSSESSNVVDDSTIFNLLFILCSRADARHLILQPESYRKKKNYKFKEVRRRRLVSPLVVQWLTLHLVLQDLGRGCAAL